MENFVISLYQRLMLRDPSEAEIASGLAVISEQGEAVLESSLESSPEAVQIQTITLPIIGLYQGILLRTPEPEGLEFWSEAISSGRLTFTDLIQTFAETSEIQERYPELGESVSNEELVNLFYENILGRVPDASGFDFWLNALQQGQVTISSFTSFFIGSDEAQNLLGVNLRAYIADLADGVIQDDANRDSLLPENEGENPVEDDDSAFNIVPEVATSTGKIGYVENDGPKVVDGNILVSDDDNEFLVSATVSISGNFAAGQDVLSFTNDGTSMGSITGSYNANTGVLTLLAGSQPVTVAEWQSALRSVTYTNTSEDPSSEARTIAFVVDDGRGVASAAAIKTVGVTKVNDAPVITSGAQSGTMTETVDNSAPASVTGTITFDDPDRSDDPSASVDARAVVSAETNVSLTSTQEAALLAGFSLDNAALDNFANGAGSTGWTYSLANSDLDFLGAGDTVEMTFEVVINDGTTTVSETVTITVTGTNDAPVINTGSSNLTDTVAET
ncbi:MAG: DUF4214 domain-containing protein, partial [Pseudomonadota bacterium]|nr:DUF4214 domain-containing protein [Pseudomonadota bacterium]